MTERRRRRAASARRSSAPKPRRRRSTIAATTGSLSSPVRVRSLRAKLDREREALRAGLERRPVGRRRTARIGPSRSPAASSIAAWRSPAATSSATTNARSRRTAGTAARRAADHRDRRDRQQGIEHELARRQSRPRPRARRATRGCISPTTPTRASVVREHCAERPGWNGWPAASPSAQERTPSSAISAPSTPVASKASKGRTLGVPILFGLARSARTPRADVP